MNGSVTVLYFAGLREQVGRGSETVALAPDIQTVKDFLAVLRQQDAAFDAVFLQFPRMRVAVNKVMGDLSTAVHNGDEIAFFPPMTGG
ncbi:molybdopterin converting factor small subunit MoeD [Acetobacter aceti NRIC 0242]|uniref:Molybdopterin synthase sulfur carrier subunit n=2 Tax=Acetobacter aceti TaxID=435 RepID=A0A6S6PLB9_ACEAC|nr:MoaD/ThiS family protein [Acetobacter aceti]GBO81094.1 molybdopterin converting factor small subunit MoeD [Acetobacter aceti NRIC 0242]TCS33211.1 molybdopterin synthase sulfur carrier subunit [Acetobacter aceti NBRC 14818]BCI68189.1 molybdopterin synthase sulfur carrier subunit [Acetobacter aceti]BCK75726.1 molybdopterin synthase sulfur carrier subunit [Acetobacter aceti NBRC 14818]GAN57905.1 molybdopterin converting factor small subunit MoeD [Acetobacter aceti NBRC 14818]